LLLCSQLGEAGWQRGIPGMLRPTVGPNSSFQIRTLQAVKMALTRPTLCRSIPPSAEVEAPRGRQDAQDACEASP